MTDTTIECAALPAGSLVIVRVDWHDERAVALRAAMDAEIAPRYADLADGAGPGRAEEVALAFAIDPADIAVTYLVLDGETPVAHAALRSLGGEWELKRLVTLPAFRGRGYSRALIAAVESDVVGRGGRRLILQTGARQPEAVRLYEGLGFTRIPVYEPYLAITESLCFERVL
ncbi:GNAT family N-acetyltransferase [Diaminobutyricibacter sp. McL0618]|uniref:GNAT family N-acetyltransferase n=1 Tax=Leifsonia sp. McL0618 TaxID=3415677 RepID=UPI003CED95CC